MLNFESLRSLRALARKRALVAASGRRKLQHHTTSNPSRWHITNVVPQVLHYNHIDHALTFGIIGDRLQMHLFPKVGQLFGIGLSLKRQPPWSSSILSGTHSAAAAIRSKSWAHRRLKLLANSENKKEPFKPGCYQTVQHRNLTTI